MASHGTDKGGIRIDVSSNRFGMLSGYYFLQDNHSVVPATFQGFSSGTQGRSQLLTIGDTKTFGSNKVNEFRAQLHALGQPFDSTPEPARESR